MTETAKLKKHTGAQKSLSLMLKPVSSRCNMRCSYCFYRVEARGRRVPDRGLLTPEKAGLLIRRLAEYLNPGDVLELGFQGGEPSLMGAAFYTDFSAQLKEACPADIHWYFQTNGFEIEEKLLSFFRENSFLVGLSLDMEESLHNLYRRDISGKGTWKRVMETKSRLMKAGVDCNILSVLTPEMASHPDRIWNFICRRDLRFVQFLPCFLPEETALKPEQFFAFYQRLSEHWLKALGEGEYYSVKFFDDLVHMLRGEGIHACGLRGRCEPQLILESDLSAYPCDFFCTDPALLGSLEEADIGELLERGTVFRNRERKLPAVCGSCPWKRICSGGCPVLFSGTCIRPEVSLEYCGYRELLLKLLPGLERAGLI